MIFETNYYQPGTVEQQPESITITPSSSNSPTVYEPKRLSSCLSPVSLKKGSRPGLVSNCKKAAGNDSNTDNQQLNESLCKVELAETPQSLSMCSSSTSFTSGQSQSPVHNATSTIGSASPPTHHNSLYQIHSEQLPYELVEPIHTIFNTTTTNSQSTNNLSANCYLEPSRSDKVSVPPHHLSHSHQHHQHYHHHHQHHEDYQSASGSGYPSHPSYMSESAVEPTSSVAYPIASTQHYSHAYQHQVDSEYPMTPSGAYPTHPVHCHSQGYQYSQYMSQPGNDYLAGNSQNQSAMYDSYCDTNGFYLNNQLIMDHHTSHPQQSAYDMETPVNYAPFSLEQDYMAHAGTYQRAGAKFGDLLNTDDESGLDDDSDSNDSDADQMHLFGHGQQQQHNAGVRRVYNKKKLQSGNAAGHVKAGPAKRARKLKQSLDDDLLAGDMSQAAKRKRKRILNRLQRAEATMREKRRMLKLNKAFEDLRKVLPITEFAKNKLSRADTLKSAIEYIEKMSEMLTLA
jgi:hypothetical protein